MPKINAVNFVIKTLRFPWKNNYHDKPYKLKCSILYQFTDASLLPGSNPAEIDA